MIPRALRVCSLVGLPCRWLAAPSPRPARAPRRVAAGPLPGSPLVLARLAVSGPARGWVNSSHLRRWGGRRSPARFCFCRPCCVPRPVFCRRPPASSVLRRGGCGACRGPCRRVLRPSCFGFPPSPAFCRGLRSPSGGPPRWLAAFPATRCVWGSFSPAPSRPPPPLGAHGGVRPVGASPRSGSRFSRPCRGPPARCARAFSGVSGPVNSP